MLRAEFFYLLISINLSIIKISLENLQIQKILLIVTTTNIANIVCLIFYVTVYFLFKKCQFYSCLFWRVVTCSVLMHCFNQIVIYLLCKITKFLHAFSSHGI